MFELNIKKFAQFPKMKRDTTQLTKYSFVFFKWFHQFSLILPRITTITQSPPTHHSSLTALEVGVNLMEKYGLNN